MKKELFIVVLVSFVNALSFSIVIPVIYVYAKKFGISDFGASLLLSLFSLGQFLATPVIGRLSDYYGRRLLLITSLMGTAVANFGAFFARAAWWLFVARTFDGLTGGNNSVAQAIIADVVPEEERPKAYGMFGAAFGAAFIVGPLLSIPLQSIGVGVPFLGSALMALLASLIAFWFLPETNKHREMKKIMVADLGFGDVFGALRRPVIGPILVVNFLAALIFGVFQFGFQPYVVEKLGASTQQISVALLLYGIVSVLVQLKLVSLWVKKIGEIKTLLVGFVGSGVALLLMLLPRSIWQFVFLAPMFGLFSFLFRPILASLTSRKVRKEDQGVAMGLLESYLGLATAIGPFLGGLVVGTSLSAPFVLASAVAFIGFVIVVRLSQELAEVKVMADF